MRKRIVAGNWKMNLDMEKGMSVFSEIVHMVNDERNGTQEVIVCPPFPLLNQLAKLGAGIVHIGAQNCHDQASGAYTGEISAQMIKSTGANYVIIGHSERRQYFSESNELLLTKTKQALANNLKPIFCIGETLEERNNGSYFDVLRTQLKESIFGLSELEFEQVILAYEPVWAIGTGLTASPEQAQDIHSFLRKEIENHYNQTIANNTSILYGGSCNPGNAAALFAQPDIDGGLIGGASLKSRDFTDIVKALNG